MRRALPDQTPVQHAAQLHSAARCPTNAIHMASPGTWNMQHGAPRMRPHKMAREVSVATGVQTAHHEADSGWEGVLCEAHEHAQRALARLQQPQCPQPATHSKVSSYSTVPPPSQTTPSIKPIKRRRISRCSTCNTSAHVSRHSWATTYIVSGVQKLLQKKKFSMREGSSYATAVKKYQTCNMCGCLGRSFQKVFSTKAMNACMHVCAPIMSLPRPPMERAQMFMRPNRLPSTPATNSDTPNWSKRYDTMMLFIVSSMPKQKPYTIARHHILQHCSNYEHCTSYAVHTVNISDQNPTKI